MQAGVPNSLWWMTDSRRPAYPTGALKTRVGVPDLYASGLRDLSAGTLKRLRHFAADHVQGRGLLPDRDHLCEGADGTVEMLSRSGSFWKVLVIGSALCDGPLG